MRKILSYLKPYRGKIALATVLLAVSAACDLLLPTLMADVLDKGVYGAAEADTSAISSGPRPGCWGFPC